MLNERKPTEMLLHIQRKTNKNVQKAQKEQQMQHKFTHLVPVVGHFLQAEGVADVDQVQNVLLETGATIAHRGLQKLVAYIDECEGEKEREVRNSSNKKIKSRNNKTEK